MEDYIKGVDVDTFRSMPEHSFARKENDKEKLYNIFSKVIRNLLCNIDQLHQRNIFLGDISAKNVIVNPKNNKVYFIDLGQTCLVDEKSDNFFYRTAGFYDQEIMGLPLIQQDNKQLGYLIMSLFSRANMFLKIDFTGKMSINFFEKLASINNIPSIFVDISKKLILSPSISLSNIINELKNTSYVESVYHKETHFPYALLNSLCKTRLTNQIDNIRFNDIDVTKDKADFKKTNRYLAYKLKLIKNSNEEVFDEAFIQQMLLDFNELFICANMDDASLNDISLGKIISLLYCLLMAISKKLVDRSYLTKVYDMLGFIDKKFKVENRKIVSYKTTIKSVYLSPYLYDGISGMLDIYLLIKEKFGNDDYCSAAKSLAYQLLFATMPKSLSLNRGLAGIVYVLIRYRNIYQDTFFDYYIKVMLNCFKYYMYKWDDNVYTVDPTFKKATANFKDGNEGVIFVLRKALTIY